MDRLEVNTIARVSGVAVFSSKDVPIQPQDAGFDLQMNIAELNLNATCS